MTDNRFFTDLSVSRRQLLATSSLLPLAGALGVSALPGAARAQAAPAASAMPIARNLTLGEFEVATLLAGTRTSDDDPQEIFGMNVEPETFAQVSADNFIPDDRNQFFFTPTVVRAGGETILFDTGLNAAGITRALSEAGVAADEVDVVVLTHMHGDHIGGLTGEDGAETFANARYVTGQVEFDAWAKQENEGFETKVRPLAEKMTFIGDGDSVVSGITAVAAFGHTPGHMAYHLESGGQRLMLIVDAANHYVWSLGYPDWEVKFDMDKQAAAATRRSLLDVLATDKVPFVGYHMPFPALGFVAPRGEGFEYVPASYQFML